MLSPQAQMVPSALSAREWLAPSATDVLVARDGWGYLRFLGIVRNHDITNASLVVGDVPAELGPFLRTSSSVIAQPVAGTTAGPPQLRALTILPDGSLFLGAQVGQPAMDFPSGDTLLYLTSIPPIAAEEPGG